MGRVKDIEEPFEAPSPAAVVEKEGDKAQEAEPVDAHVPEKDVEEGPASQADRERLPAEQVEEKRKR